MSSSAIRRETSNPTVHRNTFNAPSPTIRRDTFNAPSPVRKVFQNLPQISVSELMDMEIDDNSNIQTVQSIYINLFLLSFY